MSEVKGLDFDECLKACKKLPIRNFEVPYIHLNICCRQRKPQASLKTKLT